MNDVKILCEYVCGKNNESMVRDKKCLIPALYVTISESYGLLFHFDAD